MDARVMEGVIGDAEARLNAVRGAAEALEAKWNDPKALQDRLMELWKANPSPGAEERLLDWVAIYSRLSDMPPKDLVDLALSHLSDNVTSNHYEQIVEELCTRVHPNWSDEDPTQSDAAGWCVSSKLAHMGKHSQNGDCVQWRVSCDNEECFVQPGVEGDRSLRNP
jgi:hypothetical protein